MSGRIINCTPHELRLMRPDTPDRIPEAEIDRWTVDILPTSPDIRPARIGEIDLGNTEWVTGPGGDGWPVAWIEYKYNAVNDLFPPVDGVRYVVSHVVAILLAYARAEDYPGGRGDLLVPHRAVRNENGTVVGCRSLARPV